MVKVEAKFTITVEVEMKKVEMRKVEMRKVEMRKVEMRKVEMKEAKKMQKEKKESLEEDKIDLSVRYLKTKSKRKMKVSRGRKSNSRLLNYLFTNIKRN